MNPHLERALDGPTGTVELTRWPGIEGKSLRAWDAADELMLSYLAENHPALVSPGSAEANVESVRNAVVVNDAFGALAVSLPELIKQSWGDSLVSRQALERNLQTNSRAGPISVPGYGVPSGPVGLVLIKVPKHNSLLEDQLHRLRPLLSSNPIIVAGGMAKHIHTSTLALLESILGPTKTSLAHKKARLGFITLDPNLTPPKNPWPLQWSHDGITVLNYGGVFSGRSIDVGTRFLLQNLPSKIPPGSSVVDLGCGNGVVGAALLRANPGISVTFVDEAYSAVASSRETVSATLGAELIDQAARFVPAVDLGAVVEQAAVDLIVCNPPFHSDTVLTDRTAVAMFTASSAALRSGGRLLVIGNRHLPYGSHLERIFGNSKVVASNSKFVIRTATRSKGEDG